HWTMLDADTFVSPRSVDAARRAAGAATQLAEALVRGEARWGVALVRPPGHHARPTSAMGFCLLNNVGVAAAHARSLGVERVVVLDWDVHHGNGTQEMFYADPSVLYVSLHQFPYYPGTGDADETGKGDGSGYTVNVPLTAGAGDAEYAAAFDRVVCPIMEAYQPGLVLLSAGFDAHVRDPLGGMALSDHAYRDLTRRLSAALAPTCPIGVVLEGGYDLAGLRGALEATFEGLSHAESPTSPHAEPSGIHSREIQRARSALEQYWTLG
ncbi:MAG TPA: histone deacetylase, partial [Polyangiaceae bacterium]